MDPTQRFEQLAELAGPVLSAVIRRFVRDSGAAEEVLQDVLLEVWRRLDDLDPKRDPMPYLRKLAVSRSIDWLRRRPGFAIDGASAPEELVAPVSAATRLEADLSALPDHERAAILLYYQEQHSVAEIATILQASVSAVKVWLFRARAKLRPQFEREERRSK